MSKIAAAVGGPKTYRERAAEQLKTEASARTLCEALCEQRALVRRAMVDEFSSPPLQPARDLVERQIDHANRALRNLQRQAVAKRTEEHREQLPKLQQALKEAKATRDDAAAQAAAAEQQLARCRARLEPVEQEARAARQRAVAGAERTLAAADAALVKAEADQNDAEAVRAAELVALGRDALERAKTTPSPADLRVQVLRDQLDKAEAEAKRLGGELKHAATDFAMAMLAILAFEHDDLAGQLIKKSASILKILRTVVAAGRRVPSYHVAEPEPLVVGRAPTLAELMRDQDEQEAVDLSVFQQDPGALIASAMASIPGPADRPRQAQEQAA